MLLFLILVFTFLGSFVSLLLVVWLFSFKNLLTRLSLTLTAFAAGVMLAAAFLDLLPEAIREGGENISLLLSLTLLGMIVFFILERSLLWFHHHHGEVQKEKQKPVGLMITIGDALHNFLDGVVIGGSFLISIQLGIVTSLAVFFHEIPHEIGDFGAMFHSGLKKDKIVRLNIISGLAAFLGAIVSYFVFSAISQMLPYLLSFTAGNFIYIAASDLIPEIHREFEKEKAFIQTVFFFLGVGVIWFATALLHI